ncbi:MAG: LapA family protein [Fibrobacterota bacterium]|nr:LapA family protein [Fibrobacterota bacterium]
MKYLKRFILLAILILLGIFAFRNQSYLGKPVELVFIHQTITMVLGFWLVAGFLCGAFIYMIIDLPRDIVLKRDLRRKAHEIARLQSEVNRLQAQSNAQPPSHPPYDPDLEKRLGL